MPKLEIFQSLWAMELRRPDGVERGLAEAFALVAEAGFDGMAIDYNSEADIARARAAKPLFEQHGLGCFINAFPPSIEGLTPILEMAKAFDARFVNMIGQVMPLSVDDSVAALRRWIDMAARVNMPLLFETHRNCTTNDLFATLQMMEQVPELRLCADLSHYLVDREFPYPIAAENQALIDRVLARSDAFQGRVASREQIQIALGFPQNQKWVAVFKDWWEKGLRRRRADPPAGGVINFCCELGPPEYAITGADGYELSDRWAEALVIKGWIEEIWAGLEAED